MKLIAIAALLVLSGCASREVILTNDKGEHRYCYLEHRGSYDSIPASDQFNRCLNEAGTAGFRKESK